jgi:hypothetical protein
MSPAARSSVPSNFQITLEGLGCGQVKSVDGGSVFAVVVVEPVASDGIADKHIGSPQYEPFTIEIGLSLAKAVYDWISDTLKSAAPRKSGAILACDFQGQAISQREFTNALITEVGFPTCDASSKQAGSLVIKFAPEQIRVAQANGRVRGQAGQAKQWLTSCFKLQIDGLDCTKVSRVDAFSIKQAVVIEESGDGQSSLIEPGGLAFPDLKVTLAEQSAGSWYQWYENFLLKGDNGEDREKDGALILLSNNLQQELARIRLYNMGLFSLGSVKSDADGSGVARVVAGLYCERMELVLQAT